MTRWPILEPSSRATWQGFWLMGGGELIASFLDEHASDEFVISVVPVFIGEGIPLIARRHCHVPLDLHSVERFEDGVVQLRYRVRTTLMTLHRTRTGT